MSAMEKVAAGATVLGSGAAGAVLGANRMGRNVEALNARVLDDIHALETNGTLPYADPPMSIQPRPRRHFLLCHLMGAALGAVVMGLGGGMVGHLMLAGTHSQASATDQTGGVVVFALFASLVGVLIPGLFPLGGLLWLRESRSRVDDVTRDDVALYFRERGEVRECLLSGRITPHQAAQVLAPYGVGALTAPQRSRLPMSTRTPTPTSGDTWCLPWLHGQASLTVTTKDCRRFLGASRTTGHVMLHCNRPLFHRAPACCCA